MKLIFEINHPAQVHLLRNLYYELIKNKHFIKVFIKRDTIISKLMRLYDIPFNYIGYKGSGIFGKLIMQIFFDFKMLIYVKLNKINIGIGSSMTNDHVSALSSLKSIHLSDDDEEVVPLMKKFAYPFTTVILSPDCVKFRSFISKNVNYSGYHELAYLHPKRFKPDPNILNELDLNSGSVYFILRFNSFKAHHDIGVSGLSLEQKLKLIDTLKPKGKIIITTEGNIEPEFKKYQLMISPEKIHTLLYYATLFIGDSQTMTSEAAVLGTPALRCNSFVGQISYLEEEQHKYKLAFGYKPDEFELLINKIYELLSMSNLKEEWQKRRQNMLVDKIDVTSFMVWFIENFPESMRIMKENPNYQFKFK